MAQLNSVVDVLKLLDKSNCRKCGKPTCMAFAACVLKGEALLQQCPGLTEEVLMQFGDNIQKRRSPDQDGVEALDQLKSRIPEIDLEEAASRVGGTFSNGRLTLKIMGKDFSVDSRGNLYSDIHINSWVAAPFLSYVIEGKGAPPTGNWISFRELTGGMEWYGLFSQQCEKRLKKVADSHTDLFEFMLDVFSGKQEESHFQSDISLVLHPLPRVPIMICYWKPEEGMESDLSIFFDAAVEDNLPTAGIYTLATGMTTMFEKVVLSHGPAKP